MKYQEFYDRCMQLPEREHGYVKMLFKTLDKYFDGGSPKFDDEKTIRKLFAGSGNSVGKQQYYRKRKYVRMFYDYLKDKGLVDERVVEYVYSLERSDLISNDELYGFYFESLDKVIEYISKIGDRFELYGKDDLLNIKAIAILSWNGVDVEPGMISMLKSDLHRNKTLSVGDRVIQLDDESYEILRMYSEIDVHRGFPSGKLQYYLPSEYLFRSARITKAEPNNISKAIMRFNRESRRYGKELSLVCLKKNGLFKAIHDNRDGRSLNAMIIQYFGCDRPSAVSYKELYLKWEEYMFGGGEV